MTTPTALPPKTDPRDALPRLDRHKPKCGPVQKSKVSRWRAYVLIGVHVVIVAHVVHWLATGSTVTPVEPSEAMQTLEGGGINAGFLLFVALIASTLVFGRWFCGWACHVVALQDLCAWLLGRVGLKPRPVRSRLLVLAPFVVAGHMFVWPQIESWIHSGSPPVATLADREFALMTEDLWQTFPGWWMATLTVIVAGFLIVWWLGAKGFCNYGCPYGAFFAIADRFAPGRIKVTDACDACGHCTNVCTSNVRVHEEVAVHRQIADPACMKCMDCVSVCPKDALYFGFALPKPFAISRQRATARADFTWPEEIALAIVAFAATMGFRGAWLGEGVPLLMAVGLGIVTSAFALLGWRLLVRPAMQFQRTELARGGRLLLRGRLAFAAILLWLLFAAHAGIVNRVGKTAVVDAGRAIRELRTSGVRDDAALSALAARLATVDTWSLVTEPLLLGTHGLVLRELGRHEEAIRQLERMVARRAFEPVRHGLVPADNALANYYLGLGRLDAAEALARAVLTHAPQDRTANALLELIAQRR